MKRKPKDYNPLIIGHVRDVEGSHWDVRRTRPTKHGFDLQFGSPDSHLGSYRGGLPRLIATRELADYWEANKTKHDGVLYDLPAGRSTLKRVRRRLGCNYLKDIAKFWAERIDDLKTLTVHEFSARHNIPADVVSDARLKLLGTRMRPFGWWLHPGVLKVLRAETTLREAGAKLGISISQVNRLRTRAQLLKSAA